MLLWNVTVDNKDESYEAVYSRVYRRPISKDEPVIKRSVIAKQPRELVLRLFFMGIDVPVCTMEPDKFLGLVRLHVLPLYR